MNRTAVCVLVLCLLAPSCGPGSRENPPPALASKEEVVPKGVTFGPDDPKAEKVSMVRLLAAPMSLDKRPVAVVGYLDLAFESDHFCLHKEDAENLIITNCVWISVPDSPEVLALNRRYVAVWGVVSVGRSGHMGLFDLSIQKVTQIAPMLNKEEMKHMGKAQ